MLHLPQINIGLVEKPGVHQKVNTRSEIEAGYLQVGVAPIIPGD